jgi:homogentisate 1,2-dioxygenase
MTKISYGVSDGHDMSSVALKLKRLHGNPAWKYHLLDPDIYMTFSDSVSYGYGLVDRRSSTVITHRLKTKKKFFRLKHYHTAKDNLAQRP